MSPTSVQNSAREAGASNPFRVMVVDDSVVIRGLMTRWLEEDPAVAVVASARDGLVALDLAAKTRPEVVVLDIEMPGMDGMTLLPKLLAMDPGLKVIMASTLTLRNAGVSLRALAMGAADYVPKPTARGELHGSSDFRRELVKKVRALATARRSEAGGSAPILVRARPPAQAVAEGAGRGAAAVRLRPPQLLRPEAIAIGSSTGGPNALFQIFNELKATVRQPIFITQHMPPIFTATLAEHIAKTSGSVCREAAEGMSVAPGEAYVAPGDHHMAVRREDGCVVIRLNQEARENFCRPSVDPMMRSLIDVYGRRILMVVLTGMGSDGLSGARRVVESGGMVIAQDERSSVVWGMPGAVAKAGLCSAVLPLTEMAAALSRVAGGGEP